jgi:ATP-dependent RNA helicase DHX29
LRLARAGRFDKTLPALTTTTKLYRGEVQTNLYNSNTLGPSRMAKKKKTQLKPVARGFATTSVPKKIPPRELSPDVYNQDDDVEESLKVEQGTDEVSVTPAQSEGSRTGEQSLQYLVDKFQEKTEKDIARYFADPPALFRLTTTQERTRTIKVCFDMISPTALYSLAQAVEADRRFSKSLPFLTLDPSLTDRIISLALEPDVVEGTVTKIY